MALIVKDTLIRRRDGALPVGSSGFFVSVPSVFLFGLSDGDKIIGEIKIKEGEEKETKEKEITLILEKAKILFSKVSQKGTQNPFRLQNLPLQKKEVLVKFAPIKNFHYYHLLA